MKKRIISFILVLSLTVGGSVASTIKAEAIELTDIVGINGGDFGNILTDIENVIKSIEPSEAQKLFDFVEKQIEAGNWETKEGTDKVIEEGEKLFNIQLTESQREKLEKTIDKVKSLNISPEFLLEQAKKVYEKYGGKLEENNSEAKEEKEKETDDKEESPTEGTFKDEIRKEVNNSIKDYFATVVKNVKDFIKGFLNIQDI